MPLNYTHILSKAYVRPKPWLSSIIDDSSPRSRWQACGESASRYVKLMIILRFVGHECCIHRLICRFNQCSAFHMRLAKIKNRNDGYANAYAYTCKKQSDLEDTIRFYLFFLIFSFFWANYHYFIPNQYHRMSKPFRIWMRPKLEFPFFYSTFALLPWHSSSGEWIYMFNSIAVYAIRIQSMEYVNDSAYCSSIPYEFHFLIWFWCIDKTRVV